MHTTIFPIGPQHPSLKEPIFLKLHLDGSHVVKAEFNMGYSHRGVEKCAEGYFLDAALHAVQRTCGICSQCHSLAFLNAIEQFISQKPTEKVYLQRMMIGELERMHSHILWAGLMAHEIGLEALFMYYWREREKILDVFDELTGNRVHHSSDLVGTVKRSFGKKEIDLLLRSLDSVEPELKDLREVIRNDSILASRFKKHGKIKNSVAKEFGLVGPVARASGIDYDVRRDAPYMAYLSKELRPNVFVREAGDAWARSMIRCDEMLECIRLLRKACEMIDPSEEVPKKPNYFVKQGIGVGRVEAPRGENFHFVKIEQNRISRLKLRTPTLANVIVYSRSLEGEDLTDVPVIVMSLDPCISCMERVAVIKNGKQEIWNSHELTEGKKHD